MSNSSLAFETLRSKCRLVQHLLTSFKHALYSLWASFFRSHLLGCHATDRIAVWYPNKLLQSQFVLVCLWLVVMETTHDLIIRVSGKVLAWYLTPTPPARKSYHNLCPFSALNRISRWFNFFSIREPQTLTSRRLASHINNRIRT